MFDNPFGFVATVPAAVVAGDWLLSIGGEWVGASVARASLVRGAGGESLYVVFDLAGPSGAYQTAIPLLAPNGRPLPGARQKVLVRRAPK